MGSKRNILISIGVFVVTLILIILSLIIIENTIYKDYEFCDYDTCSQKSSLIFDHGERCFDSENIKCKEFLDFFNRCQSLKKKGDC